jgi:serine/threonine-protein kinase
VQDIEASSLIGQALGEYRLHDVLGVGGMAAVYRATDVALEREVAVKVLPASVATDADYVQRFREEAKRVAALNHPHIVPIYAFGQDEERGHLYHVMPVLDRSLRDRLLQEGHVPPEDAVRLVQQVASALEAAHALEFVHRDVKPENILLDAEGNALLTDFGIARPLTVLRQVGVARTLSQTGMPVGTPEYMAPEQLRAVSPLDQRVDVYALGAVLYELLIGTPPHTAASPFEVAALALSAPIVPPAQCNSQVWPALDQVVLKALAREPANRYPDMQSFSAALDLALLRRDARGPETAATMPLPFMRLLASLQGVWPTSRGQRGRRIAALALAVLLLVGAGGSALVVLGKDAPEGATTGSGTATVATTPQTQPSITPHNAATAAETPAPQPHPSPTSASPSPSPSPTPAPTLIIQPTPLVLQPGSPPGTCVATQTITNTTSQTVGWQWQPPQVGGFHFQFKGGQPPMDWPKDLQPGIPPGGTDTFTATSNCQPQPKSYAILLTDTLGDQYTFVLQLH